MTVRPSFFESTRSRRIWWTLYCVLWLYRALYSFVAQNVVSGLTSLGDSSRYQLGSEFELSGASTWTLSTAIADGLGLLLNYATGGSASLANFVFQTIAFMGLVAFLRRVEPRGRLLVFGLLMTPSFTIWSSVAGKEALVVGALGFCIAYLIELFEGRGRLRLVYVVAITTIAIFKVHYVPAVGLILVGGYLQRFVRQRALSVLLGAFIALALLIALQDTVGKLALQIVPHFAGQSGSRPAFWHDPSDVLIKAPEGMLQAFVGPTWQETSQGFLRLAAFWESIALILVMSLVMLRSALRAPLFSFWIAAFGVLLLLFATYPLGIMNGGSAIRYRTSYLPLLFFLTVVFMRLNWRPSTRRENVGEFLSSRLASTQSSQK